jgi:hypothetical protein
MRRYGSVAAAARVLGVARTTFAHVASDSEVRQGTRLLFESQFAALDQGEQQQVAAHG